MRIRRFTTGPMRVYDCRDVAALRGRDADCDCCSSCHEDDDEGYAYLCQTENDEGTEMAETCCAFLDACPKNAADWAKLREMFP